LIDDVFVDLRSKFALPVYLKCEAFNFAGSVKLKAAVTMVRGAESEGLLRPGSVIVESSSGNLGVALSVVAASRGYEFICVTDPRSSQHNRGLMAALGARVIVVDEPDGQRGFLASRIRYVQDLCRSDGRFVWLNQYANPDNWRAHYRLTAPAILAQFPDLDYLFVGTGTTGTLMGCARYLRDRGHPARVIAVDAAGSVTFGGPARSRYIPGLGTSRRPELVDESLVDDIVMVEEHDTVVMCRRLARRGFLFGGSTGTVLAGVERLLPSLKPDPVIVAISPDLGDRYLDTLYDDLWVAEHFGLVATLAGDRA
jgi:cysteine synthase A